MGQTAERLAYPLTFVFKQEGSQWSALACEVDVASCGDTLSEAREGLKEAVELYVSYMLEHGLRDNVSRAVPSEDLTEFCAGCHSIEYHTMTVDLVTVPALRLLDMQFVRSQVAPTDCRRATAVR